MKFWKLKGSALGKISFWLSIISFILAAVSALVRIIPSLINSPIIKKYLERVDASVIVLTAILIAVTIWINKKVSDYEKRKDEVRDLKLTQADLKIVELRNKANVFEKEALRLEQETSKVKMHLVSRLLSDSDSKKLAKILAEINFPFKLAYVKGADIEATKFGEQIRSVLEKANVLKNGVNYSSTPTHQGVVLYASDKVIVRKIQQAFYEFGIAISYENSPGVKGFAMLSIGSKENYKD